MSIFAGVFSRRSDQAIPNNLIDELRKAVSRFPDEEIRSESIDERIFIAKVDIGALTEPGELFNEYLAAVVAGDPLLQEEPDKMPVPRAESLGLIANDLATGQIDSLCLCRGTFCAAVYDKTRKSLHLIADKLGVRPIYYWVLPDYIVFATALRILEALPFGNKTLKLQGVAELACFGYPLSDRTPYENIFTLHAGEIVSIDTDSLNRKRYWHWDELTSKEPSDITPPQRLYRLFVDAVKLRLRGEKFAAAFLSGGLDSRAIVATLKNLGAEVFTANFGPIAGSQEQVFGQLAADRLGVHYRQLPYRPIVEGDAYSKDSVIDWFNSIERQDHCSQRPKLIWSGDGGSVGLGHVYLNPDIVAASRSGNLQEATEKFMAYNRWGLSAKLLKRQIAASLDDMVREGIRTELESVHPADHGRIFYLFLMLNDQRRHLFNYFENLDLTRVEFELPFFDADFIAGVMQESIDPFLRHVFYLDWLKCFPPGVLETPWQAYPNHVPCPLPQPDGLKYQWDKLQPKEVISERNYAALIDAKNLLRESGFSRKFLNSWHMMLLIFLLRWGKADRTYLLRAPKIIFKYWSRTAKADH